MKQSMIWELKNTKGKTILNIKITHQRKLFYQVILSDLNGVWKVTGFTASKSSEFKQTRWGRLKLLVVALRALHMVSLGIEAKP